MTHRHEVSDARADVELGQPPWLVCLASLYDVTEAILEDPCPLVGGMCHRMTCILEVAFAACVNPGVTGTARVSASQAGLCARLSENAPSLPET